MAKDEISVMRLVGASPKYVKGPFVVAGILSGLISSFLIILLFSFGTYFLNRYYGTYFVGFNVFLYYMRNFFYILFAVFGSGIVLGSVSSYLAVHKYLD
jgi:cell division transport system permease protein